jgi:hypothetical protein
MFNNIVLIDKAFNRVYEAEKKINYEFEPIYNRKNKNWKRNLFFSELKKDFVKDVTEFGFYPYLPKACDEQQKIKNISRFSKIDNYSKLDYIKSLYKQLNQEDESQENSNYNDLNKKTNKRCSLTMRVNRNKYKSILDSENKKTKKLFLLKQVSNPFFKEKMGMSNFLEKTKLKNNLFGKKNFKKNTSMVHICFKKDKNVNQSDNEFIDAESFIYEPKKLFFKLSQQYSREDDSSENDSNIRKSKSKSKSKSIINNISKKENSKNYEQKTPVNINENLKSINATKNSKSSLTARYNKFNVVENVWYKSNKKLISLSKKNKINPFYKNIKIGEMTALDQGFKLLSSSRKMKYG